MTVIALILTTPTYTMPAKTYQNRKTTGTVVKGSSDSSYPDRYFSPSETWSASAASEYPVASQVQVQEYPAASQAQGQTYPVVSSSRSRPGSSYIRSTDSQVASSSDTGRVRQLRREVAELSRELMSTRESMEQLRTEMDAKLRDVKVASPAKMEMQCRTDFTWWHEAVGLSLEYLDNFDIHCHHGEFLRQWRMTWGEKDKKKAIRFVCCKFKDTVAR